MRDTRYNPTLHWLAVSTAVATFPLIFMGGLVTSYHAGMSVPDWPNSYGYNMFLFPPRRWVGGILYEHTHRLAGSAVGLLSIALCVVAWAPWVRARLTRRHGGPALPPLDSPVPPPSHRYLALAVLGAVLFQGILGGLRVVLVKLGLAIIHGCFAQAFFCLVALTAVVTSQWWAEQRSRAHDGDAPAGRRLLGLACITVAVVYLQLVVGALMRHHDAGLAIPDVPLVYGKLLPPMSTEGLAAVNHLRAWQLDLDPVTLGQIWLHFGHRIGAVVVSILIITLVRIALRSRIRAVSGPAIILAILLAAQLTLGVLTVLLRKPADLASAHVAVGALVLVTVFVLTLRVARLYDPSFAAPRGGERAFPVALRGSKNASPAAEETDGLVPA